MSEASYTPELIAGYLLGSLPAAEAERLDELSVTDPAFAGALLAAESDLVDSYVLNELDDEERRQFEKHYLASPLRRDKLRFAQTFQLFGAEQSQPSVVSQHRSDEPVGEGKSFSSLRSYFRPRFALQWGFAVAALVLLIAGSWLAYQNMRLRQQVAATATRNSEIAQREQQLQQELEAERLARITTEPAPVTEPDKGVRVREEPLDPQPSNSTVLSLVLTPQLRSAHQIPTINLTRKTSWVAIKFALEPDDYSTYQVMLLDQATHQPVWHSSNLRSQTTNGTETLDIRINARLLKAGAYVVRVTGIGAGESDVTGEYRIQVTKH